jgi:hypothetical protein
MPDNIICIDTDTQDVYDTLTEYLNENSLYDEDSITESFTGRHKKLDYKKHFYFKIFDDEKADIKKLIPNKLNKNGIDIFYDCWGVAEYKNATISDMITEIDIDIVRDIFKLFNIKSNDNKNNNKTVEKVNSNTDDNDELISILDALSSSRWNDYEEWLKLYCIFLNENLPMELFDEYSKKHSKKYNETSNKKVVSSLSPDEKGYKMGTLYLMLKEDDIDAFYQLKKKQTNTNSIVQTLSEMTIAETY